MTKSKSAVAATSFFHPGSKKTVFKGDAVHDTKGVPAEYLEAPKAKKKEADDDK